MLTPKKAVKPVGFLTANRKRIALTLALLLLLTMAVGAYRRYRPDPELKEVRDLAGKLADPDLTREERREKTAEVFRRIRELPEDKQRAARNEVFRPMMEKRQKDLQDQLARYFALATQQEKNAYLDKQIDEMERRRKQVSQRPQSGPGGAGSGGNRSTDPTAAGQNRPARDPDARELRHRESLDNWTPDQRAQFAEYRQQIDDRRQARGLPAGGGRRGGY